MGRRARTGVVVGIVALVVLGAACGSGTKSATSTSTTAATGKATDVPGVGTGVTATQIKLGVTLIDYKCLPTSFVDSVYVNQPQAYNAFINNINEKGGINGRKIVPVFKYICPLQPTAAVATCTGLTDDSKVFAVVGSMYDPTGDAQLCVAKQHHTVLITDGLSQDMIDKAPPGLLITPGITSDRQLKVIMSLLKSRHVLDHKTVAVLTETSATETIKTVVQPALASMIGVKQGSEAVLSISGADTTAAQAQLDSFIEKWKTEHVNALILVGAAASSKQFVDKVKAEIPDMQLVADTTSVEDGGQSDVKAGVKPNPYDGIITAEGRIGLEHSKTKNYTYCKQIFEKQTGITIPLPNVAVKLPNGQRNNIYGNAEDACSYVTMFQDIATRVGKNLNNTNWTNTVNNFGPVRVMNTDFASLHTGKYDADDTYGLVAFDPTIKPYGDWRHVTPTENVGNTG
jgi:ABC-type branched-subunit amino acid transport system substrate-binding protein